MGTHLQFKHQHNIIMNCFKVLALIVGVCSTASIGEERESYGKQKLQCQPLQPASDSQYTYIEPGKMYQLESPNYPEFYPNNEECAFQFVSDGTIADDAPLRICNSNYEGGFINLPNRRHLGIEFNSNKRGVARGFSCYVTFWYSGAVDGEGQGEGQL